MKMQLTGTIALAALGMSMAASALPPQWDSNFGTDLNFQEDDGTLHQALGFDFPFLGNSYNYISISNNGGVALGNDDAFAGTDSVDYDTWDSEDFESEFTNSGNPMILAFNTDLDNGTGPQGDIYFKSDGASATVTWVDMATHKVHTEPFVSFQLRLDSDGTIHVRIATLQGDPITDVTQGFVVGVSDGGGSAPQGSLDLSEGGDSGTSPHAYEIWCYDDQASCYEPSQPENTAFDLEDTTLVFTPNGEGGFTVGPPSSGGAGGGGGGALTLWSLAGLIGIVGLAAVRRSPA